LQAIKLYEEVVDAFDKNYDADDVSSLSAKINFAVLLRQVSTFGIVVYQYDSVHHHQPDRTSSVYRRSVTLSVQEVSARR
jgi:hypothetical protein